MLHFIQSCLHYPVGHVLFKKILLVPVGLDNGDFEILVLVKIDYGLGSICRKASLLRFGGFWKK